MGDTFPMLPVVSHEVKTGRWPYVTICLIGLNVIVFAFEVTVGARLPWFLLQWGIVPARVNAEITAHNMATVATSMFLHVGLIHLVSNMWFLWVFGDSAEDALGPRWYLFLYLVSGFFGSMAYIAASQGSPVPVVGASGAISGVMGASLVMWPTARLRAPGVFLLLYTLSFAATLFVLLGVPVLGGSAVLVTGVLMTVLMSRQAGGVVAALVRGVDVPAWFVLGLYFGLQLYSGALAIVNPEYGATVGWWAHVGGFASGALVAFLFPKHPVVLERRPILE